MTVTKDRYDRTFRELVNFLVVSENKAEGQAQAKDASVWVLERQKLKATSLNH